MIEMTTTRRSKTDHPSAKNSENRDPNILNPSSRAKIAVKHRSMVCEICSSVLPACQQVCVAAVAVVEVVLVAAA